MPQPTPRFPLYRPDLERDACGIGLVADARGRRSHEIVEHALSALVRLTHRGAPPQTASIDGSGILTQIPWRVYRDDLPAVFSAARDTRALGTFFMPRQRTAELKALIETALRQVGFRRCHWRTVPVRFTAFDATRRRHMPAILQVAALADGRRPGAEAALYCARVRMDHAGARERFAGFSVVSLSTQTVVYKGLLTPSELTDFYPDLRDPEFSSAIAVVHQRFSTNTAPLWALAQPFHLLAHNGEIATVAGNRRWAGAAAAAAALPTLLGTPAEQRRSDSSSLDAAAQALCAAGCSLPHALSRLVPPAWEDDPALPPDVAAFYEYQACFGPSWDGPAALAFTDGEVAGALLDRNGFRPARFVRTRDDRLYLGSEAGIFDLPAREIVQRGRLGPGAMILVDTRRRQILGTPEVRAQLAAHKPYRALAARTIVPAITLDAAPPSSWDGDQDSLRRSQILFGYSQEDIDLIVRPMAAHGAEPLGSMGDDASIAPLSRFSRVLPDYFRQRFAQVTNPAIDPLRERCVMSLRVLLGPLGDWASEEAPRQAVLSLPSPVLDAADFERIAHAAFLQPLALPMVFDAAEGPDAMTAAIEAIATAGAAAAARGAAVLILTDRAVSASRAPIPPLLAVAALHERLLAERVRTRTSIVVETGEARDAHQVAVLCAYGASAVLPCTGLQTAAALGARTGDAEAAERYRHALETGLLKILSKMGVTTFAAYCGSGLFDIVGLDRTVVETYFTGAASPLGGRTLRDIAQATLERHRDAFAPAPPVLLRNPGLHSFRRGGEQHAYEPAIVRQLHKTAQPGGGEAYRAFTALVDARQPVSIRDLLAWKPRPSIPLDRVESADAILRRFFTAAMSIGALSPEAHETLAIGMNRINGRSNCGEGGEPPERFASARGRDWSGSAIKQVASARFGVTPAYLRSADELQIKIAQGSKPGEGGQLPAVKVVGHIAALRHAQPGIALISPPVHHDIYSIEDLAQLIYDLRRFHPAARIGIKLVAAAGVGIVAAGAAKAGADAILISGHDGGTGASPRGSIKHAGLPWEIGLAEAHQVLTHHGLRDRVVLQVDGGLQRGRDVAIAAALGAEEYGFGTAALVAIGCVMARQCHLDTCPAGIATQRTDLRQRFAGTPEMVEAFFRHVAEDVRAWLATAALESIDDLVGRADLLRPREEPAGDAAPIDVRPLLVGAGKRRRTRSAPAPAAPHIDDIALPQSLDHGGSLIVRSAVRNVDRAVGTALAGQITGRFGAAGLAPESVVLELEGTAGQSLGAFLVPGMSIHLHGDANDYVGKGMHGGVIAIRPLADRGSECGVAAGNAVLYGATGGRLYIGGSAGERFAVRNSGAIAVVEGVGDHGCEYMTGGAVIVLGAVGRNFASGMTGGAAYILAAQDAMEYAGGAPLDASDWARLEPILAEHWKLTGSTRAASVLGRGEAAARMFVKVAPEARYSSPRPERFLMSAADPNVQGATRSV